MEKIVSFANTGPRMYGIVHMPNDPAEAAQRIGVVILHAGRQPRRGPHRLYLKVARAACDAGFWAFRYDNTGYGDSEGPEEQTFDDWLSDALAAIRFFSDSFAMDRLILWGLCGGAVLAIHCAARLPARIDSIVLSNILFNEERVHSKGQFRTNYGKLLTVSFWLKFLRGSPVYHLKKSVPNVKRLFRRAFFPTPFDRRFDEVVLKYMKSLPQAFGTAARPTLFIFGTGDPLVSAFREDLFARPAWRAHLDGIPTETALVEGADHNFSSDAYEKIALGRTLDWLIDRRRHILSGPTTTHAASARP